MAAKQQIEPAWLEDGKDVAACPVCMVVMEQPTSGCPEGHAFCRQCLVTELTQRKRCPTCRYPIHESKLQRCRPLENLIGQLWMRCKHGPEAGEGEGGGSGAPPLAKRAKQQLTESMSVDELRKELRRRGSDTKGRKGELATRVEQHRRSDAVVEGPHRCDWRGRVCELAGHLSESCAHEPVQCPNAAAGCKYLMLRSDAALHAAKTCPYRESRCAHCRKPFEARELEGHERRCPKARIPCPNAGCEVTGARGSMREHRQECGWEEVECPCPGCDELMARAEVEEHVEASGALHLRSAWGAAEEMEEKVKGLERTVSAQADEIDGLNSVVAGLERRAEALTHVFTWSTNSSWTTGWSDGTHEFTDGVIGYCSNSNRDNEEDAEDKWMGFMLYEGPPCTMHYKCSILDKDGKVFRVVSDHQDVREPPVQIERFEEWGAEFRLTAANKAAVVRRDGSIKLRMAVYLYLAE